MQDSEVAKIRLTSNEKIAIILTVVILAAVGAVIYLDLLQPRVKSELIVYGPRGIGDLGREAASQFSQCFEVNATFIDFGFGSIEIANKIIQEKDNPQADVVFGLPEFYAKPVIDAGALEKYTPQNLSGIPQANIWDTQGYIAPLDQGYIIMLYNETILTQRGLPVPNTLDDLLNPIYHGMVVYNSPLTSGTGLSVLTWILTEKGVEPGFTYLENLKQNIAPAGYPSGFSSLVAALKSGDAAIVLSFNSHLVDPSTPNMNSTLHSGFIYREGMAVINNTKHPDVARKFIEFMLGKEGQDLVDPFNYMYPVRTESIVVNLADAGTPQTVALFNPDMAGTMDAYRDRWRTQILG